MSNISFIGSQKNTLLLIRFLRDVRDLTMYFVFRNFVRCFAKDPLLPVIKTISLTIKQLFL